MGFSHFFCLMLVFSFSVLLVFLSVVLYTNVPIFHELEERAEASNDRRFRSPTRNQTNHYTNCNPGETAFKGLASWLETGFRDGRVIERCFGRAYIGSSFTYCDSVFFFFLFCFLCALVCRLGHIRPIATYPSQPSLAGEKTRDSVFETGGNVRQ